MPDEEAKEATGKPQSWLARQLVEDVPEDIELCEFDCHKLQCRTGDWANCKRRLEYLALKQENLKAKKKNASPC